MFKVAQVSYSKMRSVLVEVEFVDGMTPYLEIVKREDWLAEAARRPVQHTFYIWDEGWPALVPENPSHEDNLLANRGEPIGRVEIISPLTENEADIVSDALIAFFDDNRELR